MQTKPTKYEMYLEHIIINNVHNVNMYAHINGASILVRVGFFGEM